jgi:hypothetical protein
MHRVSTKIPFENNNKLRRNAWFRLWVNILMRLRPTNKCWNYFFHLIPYHLNCCIYELNGSFFCHFLLKYRFMLNISIGAKAGAAPEPYRPTNPNPIKMMRLRHRNAGSMKHSTSLTSSLLLKKMLILLLKCKKCKSGSTKTTKLAYNYYHNV